MKIATRSNIETVAVAGSRAPGIMLPEPTMIGGANEKPTGDLNLTLARASLFVTELVPDLEDDWQRFVQHSADATLFHELAWKRAVQACFAHRARYLLARRDSKVVGVLPLFEIRSYFAPKFILSVPYATYGGILASTDDAAVALFDAARDLQTDVGAANVQLRSERACVPELPVEKTHAAFKRALPDLVDDVPSVYPRKARAAARQAAQRYPISVECAPANLRAVWMLYARSMRRLGSPNYPYAFFDALQREFGDRCIVQLLRVEGRAVAGLVSFIFKDAVMPYFVGVDERVKLYGLTHYLYQQCMLEGVQRGCRLFDFGRTRYGNKGPFDFKRHCGFEPTALEYQTLVLTGVRQPDLSPASSRWQLARRMWRWLPLSVTQPVGAWAARSIPG